MKAETNWIVWLLVVVVAAGVVLYLMWSKGIGPFTKSVNEAQCKAQASTICAQCVSEGNCRGKLMKLSIGCKKLLGLLDVNGNFAYNNEVEAANWCQENLG